VAAILVGRVTVNEIARGDGLDPIATGSIQTVRPAVD
jgi:hypothetical protein